MTDSLDTDTVRTAMDDRQEEWLDIVTDLIQIPSENPPGDTREIASYITDLFEDRGVPYEVIAPKETMPNVVAQFEGEEGDAEASRHLAFNGHLDTFPKREPDRWDRDPFSGAVEDGKIHGRGASDMYGGFTASLASFFYLFENRDQFRGTVTVAAVSDEETGAQWGSKHIVENYPEYRGDALISGEPSSNGIIRFAERGRAWVNVGVRGESAHTCSVPRGMSATETLINFLQDVKEIPELESFRSVPDDFRAIIVGAREQMDAAYGDGATDRILVPRVNVGIIEGGEKVNLVAENARAEVDIRLPIGTTCEQTREYLEALAADHPGEIRIEGAEGASNPFKDPTHSDYEHPIFQHLQHSAGAVRDRAPSFSCALAGTDCAYYRAEGVPAAVYGPTPHNLGSQNEYITVDDFIEVVKAQAMASAAYMAEVDR